MQDIRDGQLQITNLVRVEDARLPQGHRTCKTRRWDSFVYILSGQVDYHMAGGREFTFRAGNVHYLPLHCSYTMDVHPEGLRYLVCDFVSPSPGPRQDFWFDARTPQLYERLFRELDLRFSQQGPERTAASMAILFQIYAQIVKDHHPSYVSGDAKKKILAAQTHILRHLNDPALSVNALAAQAKMSEVHFRRLFHDLFGMSPVKYILAARVDKAKSMLGLSELRLEDIAAQAGFSSTAHLCAAFKTATGLTPSQYRHSLSE